MFNDETALEHEREKDKLREEIKQLQLQKDADAQVIEHLRSGIEGLEEKYHQATANVADLIGKLEQSNLQSQDYKASADLWATRWLRLKDNFEKTQLQNSAFKALVGTVRELTGCAARDVDDVSPEQHSREIMQQFNGMKNRLTQIVQSEDTTRMTGEQILMGYNAHKDLARAALIAVQYPPNLNCERTMYDMGVTRPCGYPLPCPIHH